MLNPNKNGYRPSNPLSSEPTPSAKATCLTYNGEESSYALREARDYSNILKTEVDLQKDARSKEKSVEAAISSRIIYQDAGTSTAV